MCPLSAPIKYLMRHKISVPALMSPVTIGQCGDHWHWCVGTLATGDPRTSHLSSGHHPAAGTMLCIVHHSSTGSVLNDGSTGPRPPALLMRLNVADIASNTPLLLLQ